MRRADRLFRLVQHLRAGRLLTARVLAQRMEVSERTVYRDVADLKASGVPVDGEAGVGYLMREGYDLPPLMFNREEIGALVAGIRILEAWGGPKMAAAARDALAKIESVLPEPDRKRAAAVPIQAFDLWMPPEARRRLDEINAAIEARELIAMVYEDVNGETTSRAVEPLCLYYWGKTWTMIGWCRLRQDFRMFRIDRIAEMILPGEKFASLEGRTLEDFLARMPQALPPR